MRRGAVLAAADVNAMPIAGRVTAEVGLTEPPSLFVGAPEVAFRKAPMATASLEEYTLVMPCSITLTMRPVDEVELAGASCVTPIGRAADAPVDTAVVWTTAPAEFSRTTPYWYNSVDPLGKLWTKLGIS